MLLQSESKFCYYIDSFYNHIFGVLFRCKTSCKRGSADQMWITIMSLDCLFLTECFQKYILVHCLVAGFLFVLFFIRLPCWKRTWGWHRGTHMHWHAHMAVLPTKTKITRTQRVWLRSVFKTLLVKSVFCHYINAQHINNHLSTLFHRKTNEWTSVHKSVKEGTREGLDPPISPPSLPHPQRLSLNLFKIGKIVAVLWL